MHRLDDARDARIVAQDLAQPADIDAGFVGRPRPEILSVRDGRQEK